MNPVTHLLASWALGEAAGGDARGRAAITWCGVLPDLDGLGILVDLPARALRLGDPDLYGRFHHGLLHGALGAVVLPGLLCLGAARRARTFAWCVVAVHLHLLFDLVGARGPTPDDIWPVRYLAPFSESGTLSWSHQWPLDGWPNIAFTLALLAFVFVRAATAGTSPLALVSRRANTAFVETVRARWSAMRREER